MFLWGADAQIHIYFERDARELANYFPSSYL